MPSYKTPTSEQVDKAVAAIAHAEQYRYFFERLENPLWLRPLREKGFFKAPPKPILDPKDNTIRYPPWPESRFLARMACHDPDTVLDIINAMPATDNALIRQDILKAALAMPADKSVDMVPRIRGWLRGQVDIYVIDDLNTLICNLAIGNHALDALELLKQLFQIAPRAESQGMQRVRPEPATRLDDWHFERILQAVLPEVVKRARMAAFQALCNILDNAVTIHAGHNNNTDGCTDYSCIWCNSIQNAGHGLTHGVRVLLVSAVRDAANQLIHDCGIGVSEILSELKKHQWNVFQRLAMHILRFFPERAPNEVRICLTDRASFDNHQLEPEYSLLSEVGFGKLAQADQDTLLGWVTQGPDLEKRRAAQKEWDGTETTDEQLHNYAECWRRNKLRPLRDWLPSSWRERYEAIVRSFGEPSYPPFQFSTSCGFVGEASPREANDLGAMGTKELVAFLREWRPPSDDPRAPSIRGLADALRRAVNANPERFAMEALEFTDLHPPYVSAVLSGLQGMAKQKWDTQWWRPVLGLCSFVVGQPRDDAKGSDHAGEQQVHWRWARREVCHLLAAGLENGPARFPFDCTKIVWDILEPLTNDPDPGPADCLVSDGEGAVDYVTSSINTVRGDAMHALIRYALWVRQELEKGPDAVERLARGFDEMPEVRVVLDRHLDLKSDPSPVIRSVYGQWFPWLCLLDEKWANSRINTIFPPGAESQSYWIAAWTAYINWCQPYSNVFHVLRTQYDRAIALLGRLTRSFAGGSTDDHLAEHLMVYYWQGRLTLDDQEGSLARFIRIGSAAVRAHAVEFVGRSLSHTDGDVPPLILERLKNFWDYRLRESTQLEADQRRTELEQFGSWFTSGKFDNEWSLEQLEKTLRICKWAEPDHLVVERLVTLAGEYPASCLECLRMLVEGDYKGWGVYSWQDKARDVLETACKSQNVPAQRAARDLINLLGAQGYIEFGELLSLIA